MWADSGERLRRGNLVTFGRRGAKVREGREKTGQGSPPVTVSLYYRESLVQPQGGPFCLSQGFYCCGKTL